MRDTDASPRLLVTSTPPTPNGDLHLGHLSGPYLAADVLVRAARARGAHAWHVTGLDDHQNYVPRVGFADGRTGHQVADRFGPRIEHAWRAAQVDLDACGHPRRDARHRELNARTLQRLCESGDLVARTRPLPWCEEHEGFVYEGLVSGGCPHCGERSGGNACEACGRPNDCADLRDPTCVRCGCRTVLRDVERLYLPLHPFRDRLVAYWSTVTMPAHVVALCQAMLEDGLEDVAVSHPGDWGLPVPISGFEAQRTYVWFEMAPGYLAVAEQLPSVERWQDVWTDPHTSTIQCFGFDNAFFHAVLFPCIFMALDEGIRLADAFVVNEFYQLEGSKFSTSRRHAIWARDLLAQHGPTATRAHLSADRPDVRQTSFSTSDFTEYMTRSLVGGWQAWLRGLGERLATPPPSAARTDATTTRSPSMLQTALLEEVEALVAVIRRACHPRSYDAPAAMRALDELVVRAQRFARAQEPLRHRDGLAAEAGAAVSCEVAVARVFALTSEPLVPGLSARLCALLGVAGEAPAGGRVDALLAAARAGRVPLGTRAALPDALRSFALLEGGVTAAGSIPAPDLAATADDPRDTSIAVAS